MAVKRKADPVPEDSNEEEEEEEVEVEVEEEEEVEEEVEEEEDEEEGETSDSSDEGEEEEDHKEEISKDDDEIDDLSSRESIKKILDPFGKDQLMDLLKEAALKDPSLVARLQTLADSDPAHRKIFVHGLSWDSTNETLASAFSPFGEFEECRAVLDRASGRCKGYGFVVFRDRLSAQRALKDPQKRIDGRNTSCQLASFGVPTHPVPEGTGRKIFISGIPDNVSHERLKSFFAKFGEIEDGPLGYDKATGKLRGFAIFVYKSVEGCKKALEEPTRDFEGSELHCQRALEGLKSKTQFQHNRSFGVPPAALQLTDLALNYAAPSMIGSKLNLAAAGFLGQNAGVGVSPSPFGFGAGMGVSPGINSMSSSVIGDYGSQAALQGLGAYQSAQQQQASTPGARDRLELACHLILGTRVLKEGEDRTSYLSYQSQEAPTKH